MTEFRLFPNGKIWPSDGKTVHAIVRVPEGDDGEDFLDHVSEAITGSLAGLVGLNIISRGNDWVEVESEVDTDGMLMGDEESELELPVVTDPETLANAFKAQFGLNEVEATHAVGAKILDYGEESARSILGSVRDVRCPAFPAQCDYVRVTVCGIEIAYWTSVEWASSPTEVMGALLGALNPH